jgi:hypothetical protein
MPLEQPLGDLLEALIDYRGKTPPKSTSGIPLITAKVIKGGVINEDGLEYVSEETYSSWMRRGFPKLGDILITTRPNPDTGGPATSSQAPRTSPRRSPQSYAQPASTPVRTRVSCRPRSIRPRPLARLRSPWQPQGARPLNRCRLERVKST